MLEQVEAGQHAQNLKMDVLQAIRFVILAWKEIKMETIFNCWQHTKILPEKYQTEYQNVSDNPAYDVDLAKGINALQFSNAMEVHDFLNIAEEEIVYEVPQESQVIENLVDMFKKRPEEESTENLDDADDSNEMPVVSIATALQSLETVRMFLFQQEDASEYLHLTGKIEKFIRAKKISLMQQTSLDQYFSQ
jgi:hypothetical protein